MYKTNYIIIYNKFIIQNYIHKSDLTKLITIYNYIILLYITYISQNY